MIRGEIDDPRRETTEDPHVEFVSRSTVRVEVDILTAHAYRALQHILAVAYDFSTQVVDPEPPHVAPLGTFPGEPGYKEPS